MTETVCQTLQLRIHIGVKTSSFLTNEVNVTGLYIYGTENVGHKK